MKKLVWVNHSEPNTIIISNSTSMGKDAEYTMKKAMQAINLPDEVITKIIPKGFISEEGQKQLCKYLTSEDLHYCKYCKKEKEEKASELLLDEDMFFEQKRPSTDTLRSDDFNEDTGGCDPFEE